MEGISELLPEEDVQKLKSVPKRLPLHEREIVRELKEFGVDVYGYDPLLNDKMIEGFGVKVPDDLDAKVDCVIVTVAHDEFREMGVGDVEGLMAMDEKPVLVDVRGMFEWIAAESGERGGDGLCRYFHRKIFGCRRSL